MQSIQTPLAPAAIGPYSQAIQVGDFVFVSGQIGIDPSSGELATNSKAQLIQIFKNLEKICLAANASLKQIVKLTIYCIDLAEFSMINDVMETYFESPYPARATLEVSALPKCARIEVEAIIHNSL